jgi:hypothetical protein
MAFLFSRNASWKDRGKESFPPEKNRGLSGVFQGTISSAGRVPREFISENNEEKTFFLMNQP